MRENSGGIDWARKAPIFLSAVAVLVLIGPFDTYTELDLWGRLAFWSVMISGVGFFMHAGIVAAMSHRLLASWPQFAQIVLGSAAAAIPGAALVIFVNQVFRGSGQTSSFPYIWVQVTVIGIIIGLVEFLDWSRGKRTEEPAVADEAPPRTALHDRLTNSRDGELISLSMKDHYVEVTTTAGAELVLLRFSDALGELEGARGFQLHRSHWAAATHLHGISKRGNRVWATLSDGRELPVSKTYAEALRTYLNTSEKQDAG